MQKALSFIAILTVGCLCYGALQLARLPWLGDDLFIFKNPAKLTQASYVITKFDETQGPHYPWYFTPRTHTTVWRPIVAADITLQLKMNSVGRLSTTLGNAILFIGIFGLLWAWWRGSWGDLLAAVIASFVVLSPLHFDLQSFLTTRGTVYAIVFSLLAINLLVRPRFVKAPYRLPLITFFALCACLASEYAIHFIVPLMLLASSRGEKLALGAMFSLYILGYLVSGHGAVDSFPLSPWYDMKIWGLRFLTHTVAYQEALLASYWKAPWLTSFLNLEWTFSTVLALLVLLALLGHAAFRLPSRPFAWMSFVASLLLLSLSTLERRQMMAPLIFLMWVIGEQLLPYKKIRWTWIPLVGAFTILIVSWPLQSYVATVQDQYNQCLRNLKIENDAYYVNRPSPIALSALWSQNRISELQQLSSQHLISRDGSDVAVEIQDNSLTLRARDARGLLDFPLRDQKIRSVGEIEKDEQGRLEKLQATQKNQIRYLLFFSDGCKMEDIKGHL